MRKYYRRSLALITDITTPATKYVKHGFKYIPLLIMQYNTITADVGGSTSIISKPTNRCNSQLVMAASVPHTYLPKTYQI